MYILNVHTNKVLQTETQMTDPHLLAEGTPQRQESNFMTENIVWSQAQSGFGTKTY
jgi:hypothetical protein